MMCLFVVQNKRRSNAHKENNTKIENIKNIKNSLTSHYAKLGITKKFDPQSNSPISQLSFCCKYKYIQILSKSS
jgi:hypothetical protein